VHFRDGFFTGHSGRIVSGMGTLRSKRSKPARESLGRCNWRQHVRNDPNGGKEFPAIITPGGVVRYGSVTWPQVSAPDVFHVDQPFLVIENWQIRFFPSTKAGLCWLADSAMRWVRERPSQTYRQQVGAFLENVAQITRAQP
jgi:hypothetical protein